MIRQMRMMRGGDVRVLKAQLDLTAQSVQATRFTAPVWSLLMALLCSGALGVFGHQSLISALIFPMIVTLTLGVSSSVAALYLSRTNGVIADDHVRHWFAHLMVMQAASRWPGASCPGCCGSRAIRSIICSWPPAPSR